MNGYEEHVHCRADGLIKLLFKVLQFDLSQLWKIPEDLFCIKGRS